MVDLAEVPSRAQPGTPAPGASEPDRRRGTRRLPVRSANRRVLLLLSAAFVVSRVAYDAAGVRFDLSALHPVALVSDSWQLLDIRLLRHDLVRSVWFLHSQPPLWNLLAGAVLHLPAAVQRPGTWALFLVFGLVLVLASYQAMVELRVPRWLAATVSLAMIVDPTFVLYENWFSYAYPTAALLAVTALGGIRFLRTRRTAWGVAFLAAASAVVLLDSTYQFVWLVPLAAVAVLAVLRGRDAARHRFDGRRLAAILAVPLVAVGGWYVKDAVLFGTATTSSWLGMNLTKTTLGAAPPGVVRALVARGALPPIAEVHAFAPVSAYVPRFVVVRHTGVAALDERSKADGVPNYDNVAYVAVSGKYLAADLDDIRLEPARYAGTVGKAVALWFVPTADYPFVAHNAEALDPWLRTVDAVGGLEPSSGSKAVARASISVVGPSPGELSWTVVALFALTLAGAPVLGWRWWRRGDRARAAAVAVLWFTTAYALAVTSLVEFGENNRFRFELGPVPVVAAVVVAVEVWNAVPTRRRRPRRRSPATTPG